MTDSVMDLTSEIERAALRVVQEVIRLTDRPVHDGTVCVLVPERIMERLENAIKERGG